MAVCPSCLEDKVCEFEWHPEVPRPDRISEALICSDCHSSLRRVAGEEENPLEGVAPPNPDSLEARDYLYRMTRRGLL
jgi:hypothetical protein